MNKAELIDVLTEKLGSDRRTATRRSGARRGHHRPRRPPWRERDHHRLRSLRAASSCSTCCTQPAYGRDRQGQADVGSGFPSGCAVQGCYRWWTEASGHRPGSQAWRSSTGHQGCSQEGCCQEDRSQEGSGQEGSGQDRSQEDGCREGSRQEGSGQDRSQEDGCHQGSPPRRLRPRPAAKKTVATKAPAKKAPAKTAAKAPAKKAPARRPPPRPQPRRLRPRRLRPSAQSSRVRVKNPMP